MNYANLGRSGLKVSRICLGCMSFGTPGRGNHPWTLDEAATRPFFKRAVELGINFWDTANSYSEGTSEEFVGRALKEFAKRDEVVLATKGFFPWRKSPNTGGLSRKAIFNAIDDSLRRLGVDYVDLYQIHRWDNETPIEETLEALHDLVKLGKTRYIGASSMYAWQFAKALYLADQHGWTRFISMQPHYNLLYREEEREMFKLCAAEKVGVIPWSPLARGRLARPWQEEPATDREKTDEFGKTLYITNKDSDHAIIDQVNELAKQRGLPPSRIATAWVLQNPVVTAPIIGATKLNHLEDAVAALEVKLSEEEIKALEKHYVPHPVAGMM